MGNMNEWLSNMDDRMPSYNKCISRRDKRIIIRLSKSDPKHESLDSRNKTSLVQSKLSETNLNSLRQNYS